MLKKYAYEFEWLHGVRSLITNITVRTPRSGKFVEGISDGVVVYDIRTSAPSIRTITPISLQLMRAIVEEVEREREQITKEKV